MRMSFVTLFPEMFSSVFNYSIIKRAQDKKIVKIELVNLRDFGIGKHRTVDDKPYGGGPGMVMRVDVLHKAIEFIKEKDGIETPFMKNEETALIFIKGKLDKAPTTFKR